MYAKNYLNFKSPGARFSISQANSNFAQIIFFIIRNYPGWHGERNLKLETLKLIKSKKERSIAKNMESLRSLIPLF